MKMFRRDEGFTLVELMVVVLIIGILVAIAIPVFNSAKANAQKKACFANQRTIEGAAQTYSASIGTNDVSALDGGLPPDVAALVPSFIAAPPICPTTRTGYSFNAGTAIVADCSAHAHYQ